MGARERERYRQRRECARVGVFWEFLVNNEGGTVAAAVVARQRARRRGVVGLFSLTSATPACLVLASNQLPEPGSKPRPSIF